MNLSAESLQCVTVGSSQTLDMAEEAEGEGINKVKECSQVKMEKKNKSVKINETWWYKFTLRCKRIKNRGVLKNLSRGDNIKLMVEL